MILWGSESWDSLSDFQNDTYITIAPQCAFSRAGTTYMEITQTRAYDGQSLIGNAGGYVGLFLGVALIQLPLALESLFQMLK